MLLFREPNCVCSFSWFKEKVSVLNSYFEMCSFPVPKIWWKITWTCIRGSLFQRSLGDVHHLPPDCGFGEPGDPQTHRHIHTENHPVHLRPKGIRTLSLHSCALPNFSIAWKPHVLRYISNLWLCYLLWRRTTYSGSTMTVRMFPYPPTFLFPVIAQFKLV